MLRSSLVLTACALSAGLPAAALAAPEQDLRLVPFPKEVRLEAGRLDLGRRLVIETGSAGADILHGAVSAEMRRARLHRPRLRRGTAEGFVLRLAPAGARLSALAPPESATGESYALRVQPGGAVVAGSGEAGLFYGVQTLCQLIRANRVGRGIPCLTLRDWPSIRWRAFQDDLTRGPSSTLEELKREAALGASLKMNVFTYYMEHQFAFRKHPLIGPKEGSLSPEELQALVGHCRPMHMEVLGNQQSLAHFGEILKHDEYKGLRETGWILCPTKEESYRLLDDMYSEVVPLLPYPFFNVCCDESQGLGTGPSKALAEQVGVGGVYVRHLRRVHDLLKEKYGKRMMMWGDIILEHPDNLAEIPKDTLMLTWGYHPGESFERQIVPFVKAGYEFFVCPGVSNWSRIVPDFTTATVNIRNFVRDGAKHGTLGVLNTSWDDDGETLNAPNWHGYAWGAECAWNASTTTPEQFNRRLGAVLFGEKGDHFGQAVALLAKTHSLPGMNGMMDGRFWQLDLGPLMTTEANERASARRLLEAVQPAIAHLEACRKEATANAELLDALLLGARRMELIGRRLLDRLDASAGYEAACDAAPAAALERLARIEGLLRRNRDAHERLGREFVALWQRENRPFAMDRVTKRYAAAVAAYDAALGRVANARKEAEAGRVLPSLAEVGLEIVEMGARRTRPQRVVRAPLDPDTPWAEPAATHRVGLAISAGAAERENTPLEIDLRLPEGLAERPVRAFLLTPDGKPQEIPAQVGPSQNPGRARIALVLSGLLAKGATARGHVYLGLPAPGPALPEAVSVRAAEGGGFWIENDRVRVLLGPEGAHLYRWELKAEGNRDITEPGESDWHGFLDAGGDHRKAKNTIALTAKGPAMVRAVCTDEHGLVKTISLYAGVPLAETALSAPVGYFWAFDDPKVFAADGPAPGSYLFSTGATGAVGKGSDGVAAQVRAYGAAWSAKFLPGKLCLAMVTPEVTAMHVIGPGSGAGGVGIEGGSSASHFVLYGGALDGDAGALCRRLQQTFDTRAQPEVTLHEVQAR